MKAEQAIQNEIRLALAPESTLFRANVGQAWTGSDIQRLPDGSVLIRDARPFQTGMPNGFSDLFGFVHGTGRFVAIEVKRPKGRVSDCQAHFIRHVSGYGGLAGIARSVEDAQKIIKG
jgi:hypothetical protein